MAEKIITTLCALLKVKTITTLTVIFVFAQLSLSGAISSENVMLVVTTVIAFYFGTQFEGGSSK